MRQNDALQRVAEDLLSISPLIFRTVRRKLATMPIADLDITPLHFEIMVLLEEQGTLHVSEIGQRLQIAKAQMTKLIEKLVALNIVERTMNPIDRRTINVSLTSQAKVILKDNKTQITQAVQNILATLSLGDLENLSNSLRNVRDVLLRAQTVVAKELS
jgi:DNA-binding MarR family transcriptional regulator